MIFHQGFSGRSPPKYSYLRVSLPPRSGALNLAVRFNARDGREMNLRVASATAEPAATFGARTEFNRRWRDAGKIHAHRGFMVFEN